MLDNDAVTIDFKPLYTCIHIHDTLDAREELQLRYQDDRRVRAPLSRPSLGSPLTSTRTHAPSQAQARLLLSSTSSLSPFSLSALTALLEEIVGFFLIESHVLRTTNSFRSEQDVEDLWDEMCERVVRIVDQGLATCEEAEVFLGTKFKILSFVQTLEVSPGLNALSPCPGLLCEIDGAIFPRLSRRRGDQTFTLPSDSMTDGLLSPAYPRVTATRSATSTACS